VKLKPGESSSSPGSSTSRARRAIAINRQVMEDRAWPT
jgi:hypothetical protein